MSGLLDALGRFAALSLAAFLGAFGALLLIGFRL